MYKYSPLKLLLFSIGYVKSRTVRECRQQVIDKGLTPVDPDTGTTCHHESAQEGPGHECGGERKYNALSFPFPFLGSSLISYCVRRLFYKFFWSFVWFWLLSVLSHISQIYSVTILSFQLCSWHLLSNWSSSIWSCQPSQHLSFVSFRKGLSFL